MKLQRILLLALVIGLSSTTISCTTTSSGEGGVRGNENGISAGDPAMSRRSIYELQDRTFRQLAY